MLVPFFPNACSIISYSKFYSLSLTHLIFQRVLLGKLHFNGEGNATIPLTEEEKEKEKKKGKGKEKKKGKDGAKKK